MILSIVLQIQSVINSLADQYRTKDKEFEVFKAEYNIRPVNAAWSNLCVLDWTTLKFTASDTDEHQNLLDRSYLAKSTSN